MSRADNSRPGRMQADEEQGPGLEAGSGRTRTETGAGPAPTASDATYPPVPQPREAVPAGRESPGGIGQARTLEAQEDAAERQRRLEIIKQRAHWKALADAEIERRERKRLVSGASGLRMAASSASSAVAKPHDPKPENPKTEEPGMSERCNVCGKDGFTPAGLKIHMGKAHNNGQAVAVHVPGLQGQRAERGQQ